jgi:hypothetical protein
MAQSKINGVILSLQDQLVIRNKRFQQTEAAKELRSKLEELLNGTGSSGSEDRRGRLRSIAQQIGELKIPLGMRIKMMLGLVGVRSLISSVRTNLLSSFLLGLAEGVWGPLLWVHHYL